MAVAWGWSAAATSSDNAIDRHGESLTSVSIGIRAVVSANTNVCGVACCADALPPWLLFCLLPFVSHAKNSDTAAKNMNILTHFFIKKLFVYWWVCADIMCQRFAKIVILRLIVGKTVYIFCKMKKYFACVTRADAKTIARCCCLWNDIDVKL